MRLLLPFLLLALHAGTAPAQTMVDLKPLTFSTRSYAEVVAEAGKGQFGALEPDFRRDSPERDWKLLRSGRVSASGFSYLSSGGVRVTGFVVKPKHISGRAPVLIWARGGIGDIRQGEGQIIQMAGWARRGYIVIGSNYRGAAGSEGNDEFAGADVDDIKALVPLIAAMRGADPARIVALGFSRGGTMLLRAVAEGLPVKAVVTVGAVADLEAAARERPDLGKTFERLMPDYAAEKASGFCRRSATCWPDRINVPILLVQGGADQAVSPDQSRRLADLMERAHKPYRLLVVGGADHGLNGHRSELFDSAERFFAEIIGPARCSAKTGCIDSSSAAAATVKQRSLSWTGTGRVFPGGTLLELGVRTSVLPFVSARSETWILAQGPESARVMIIEPGGGWIERGGKREAMPESMLRHERQQFAIYGQMQVAIARAAALKGRRGESIVVAGVEGISVSTEFRFDRRGVLAEARNEVDDPDGAGKRIAQIFKFSGSIGGRGLRWPRHMEIVQNGQPYFTLDLASFTAK